MSSAGAMPCSHICQLPEPGCWFSSTTGDTEGPTVKLLALLAVPAEVVTLMGPLEAPVGTVAVIVVAEPTVKPALAPLNSTAVAPVKLVPLMVTLVPTGPPVGVKLVTVGGLRLETVTVTGAEVVRRPAASRATAVSVCEPLLALVVFQETEYGAAASSTPRLAPSSRNCTPTTPTLSEALAVTVVVAPTVAPETGAVMLTVGGVVPLNTATVTGAEVVRKPAASRAAAVSVCEPLLALVVFQETEY